MVTVSEKDRYYINTEKIPVHFLTAGVDRLEVEGRPGLKCEGCGYEWNNRTDEPKVCPGCQAFLAHDESEREALLAVADVIDSGEVAVDGPEESAGGSELDDVLGSTETETESEGAEDSDDLSDILGL